MMNCDACGDEFEVGTTRQTYGTCRAIVKPRLKVLKRLNLFAKSQAWSRNGSQAHFLAPLSPGAQLCRRADCLYVMEMLYTQRKRNNARPKHGYATDVVHPVQCIKTKPMSERYKTSSAAVMLVTEALMSSGISFSKDITIADICGNRFDSIAVHFSTLPSVTIKTNDFNSRVATHSDICLDASLASFPGDVMKNLGHIDIIMTSPPYSLAVPIIRNALSIASRLVVMKLPLNFICPGPRCSERIEFLKVHPPSSIIPLSRSVNKEFYSLNMDEAWFVWCVAVDVRLQPLYFM